jgi:hypothetical protein
MVHRSISASWLMIHAEAVSRTIDQCGAVHDVNVVVDEDEAVDGLDA